MTKQNTSGSEGRQAGVLSHIKIEHVKLPKWLDRSTYEAGIRAVTEWEEGYVSPGELVLELFALFRGVVTMTKQNTNGSEGRQAGELTGVEITPAMLRAGAEVAGRFIDMEWEAIRDVHRNMILAAIYRAMCQAA